MIEVFITDIEDVQQFQQTTELLTNSLTTLRFNLDRERSRTGTAFPCSHTVLRVEGKNIDSGRIIAAVRELGFRCEVLADKICR